MKHFNPGMRFSRADAVRVLIARGLAKAGFVSHAPQKGLRRLRRKEGKKQ